MYPRYSENNVKEALNETPVVFIMGPRQSGKTTLVKTLINESAGDSWTYLSLDDQAQFKLAQADPIGFIRNLPPTKIALDAIQRVPELLGPIKQVVEEHRHCGRFLLVGASKTFLEPQLTDAPLNWVEAVKLTTLSEYEIRCRKPGFLAKILREEIPTTKDLHVRDQLLKRLVTGCFPEPLQCTNEPCSQSWYRKRLSTLIQRDIRELTYIDHPDLLFKLLKLVASHTGKLVNLSDFGVKLGLDRLTIKKYLVILEQMFLLEQLPAWHSSEYNRLVKAPKLQLVDTGMMCAMRGFGQAHLQAKTEDFSVALKSFVYNKLRKQSVWADEPLHFSHYRDKDKVAVDVIIENAIGSCFAIETKAGATISAKDFIGLRRFKRVAGDRFKLGILLYDGDHALTFEDNLYAVPLGALWS